MRSAFPILVVVLLLAAFISSAMLFRSMWEELLDAIRSRRSKDSDERK